MNKQETKEVLSKWLGTYKNKSYQELLSLLSNQDTSEVVLPSGETYQVEAYAVWDDKKKKHLRVIVAIDYGGISALHPQTDDFILAPNGVFVGE